MPLTPSKLSREIGRVYEKQYGKTGAIKSGTDLITRPDVVLEDRWKHSGAYYAGKALIPKTPSMPSIPQADPRPTPRRLSIESEEAKRRRRAAVRRRRGWASTIMTRGGNLGTASIGKAKALGV